MTSLKRWSYDQALAQARKEQLGAFISIVELAEQNASVVEDSSQITGELAGLPYAVKDNIDTVALPTTGNTPALVGSFPAQDNPVVAQLNRAGARMIGKTNLHEVAFGITTSAAAFPPSRNPFDTERSPGGSSGGSGAAVGAGILPFALGTDTGGSISIPAAWCGVYGYRPSISRWPEGGTIPLSRSRDVVGVIAESLDLVQRVDRTVRGQTLPTEPKVQTPIRVGVPRPESQFLHPLEPDVREVWDKTLRALEAAQGMELVEVQTDHLHEQDSQCGIPIVLYETARDLSAYLAALPRPIPFEEVSKRAGAKDVSQLLALAYEQRDNHDQYHQMMKKRDRLRLSWDQLFDDNEVDFLLHPTTPLSAVPVEEDITTTAFGGEVPTFATVIRNTGPGSNAAQPAITIPAGLGSLGLPVGVTMQGMRDGDDHLLSIASMLDDLIGVRSPLLTPLD